MTSQLHKQQNIAVLIDAQNTSSALIHPLLLRAACYGRLVVKRAYADWTRPQMRGYEKVMRRHAVETTQLFPTATGKNSADILMTMDVMDLLRGGVVDAICLASSDSDFTHVAMRIRGEGLNAYGIGGRHTPQGFVQACSRFIYCEDLVT